MHYYSPHRLSSLFDCREMDSRPDDLRDEAVYVADDGLVYPRVEAPSPQDPMLVCWTSSCPTWAVLITSSFAMPLY